MSLRDQILQADDLRREGPLEIKEWKVTADQGLYMRSMTAEEGLLYSALADARKDKQGNIKDPLGLFGWVLARVLVKESGEPVFAPGDIAALERKNRATVQTLYQRALALSDIETRAVEEARKNSNGALISSSSSD